MRNQQVFAIDWADKREILANTDIIKVNEHEMEVITGLRNPRMAALRLAEWGVKEVCVTLGSYGSIILVDGEFHEIPLTSRRRLWTLRAAATPIRQAICGVVRKAWT